MSSIGQVNEINVKVTGRYDDLEAKLAAANKKIDQFAAQAQASVKSQATKVAAEMKASAAKIATQVNSVGNSMTMKIALPLAAVGVAAAKTAMDFEKAMAKVQGLAGVSAAEIGGLRTQVLSLAGDTARAPEELAKGLYFVESAGLKGAQAMDVLKASAMASAAGLGETQTIANALTSAMNAYGPAALSAGHATDIMIAAVTAGKMAPEDLAGALGKVLPIASTVGVSFADVTAAIASMSREGLNAQEGATALRQTLAALEHPSKQTKDALHSVGLTASEVKKELADNLIEGLNHLSEAFNGNDEALARVFPNIRAFTGVLNLTGKQGAEVEKVFDSVRNASGNLGKAFEVASQTDAFKMEQAFAELKVAGVQLGSALSPVIKEIAGDIRDLSKWFQGLTDDQKKQIVEAGKAAIALALLTKAAGSLALGYKSLVSFSSAATTAFKGIAGAAAAANVSVAALTASWAALLAIPVGTWMVLTSPQGTRDANAEMGQHNTNSMQSMRAALDWKNSTSGDQRRALDAISGSPSTLLDAYKRHLQDAEGQVHLGSYGVAQSMTYEALGAFGMGGNGRSLPVHAQHKGSNPLAEQTKEQKQAFKDAKAAAEEYRSTIAGLRVDIAMVGKGGDPVAKLLAERKYGGDAAGWSAGRFQSILALTKQKRDAQKAYDDAQDKAAQDKKLAEENAGVVSQANNMYAGGDGAFAAAYKAQEQARQTVEERNKSFKEEFANQAQEISLLGATTSAERVLYETQQGRLKDLTELQKALLVAAAESYDAKQKELEQTKQLQAAEAERAKQVKDFIKDKQKEIDLLGIENPLIKLQWDLNNGMYADLDAMSKIAMLMEQNAYDQKKATFDAEQKQQQATQAAAAKTAQDITNVLGKAALDLGKGFKKSFADIIGGFKMMIAEMAVQSAENDLQKWLTGVFGGNPNGPGTPGNKGNAGSRGAGGGLGNLGSGLANGVLGGIMSHLFGARASGGVVGGNTPYWVGEEGPELFVPGSAGSVLNNSESMRGGGDVHVHVHGVTDASSFLQSAGQIRAAIGKATQHAAARNH